MIRRWDTLKHVKFPVYELPRDTLIEYVDGLTLANNKILDDKNMPGITIGTRRLQTHTALQDLHPIRRQITTPVGLFGQSGDTQYIDTDGKVFTYSKTRIVKVVSKKITKITRKEGIGTVMYLQGIKTPFVLKRPPHPAAAWADVIYLGTFPWLVNGFSVNRKRNYRLKI